MNIRQKKHLPSADELFMRFFDSWYDEDSRKLKSYPATRPDMLVVDEYRGQMAESISPLSPEGQDEVKEMIEDMLEAGKLDLLDELDLSPELKLDWVDAFDKHYSRKQIADLIDESEPEDFSNSYIAVCCEFGALLGERLQASCPELEWVYSWPYWESSLLHPDTGSLIAVFHWAIKKMSEYGVDDACVAKVKECVAELNNNSKS